MILIHRVFHLNLRKQQIYRGFLENRHAEDLRNLVGRLTQLVSMLEYLNQHIHHHRNPQLRLDGIGSCAEESLDVQVLLHPFEEQLDLPSLAIQQRDRQRIERQVIGKERQPPAGIRIDVADPPQRVGIGRAHV